VTSEESTTPNLAERVRSFFVVANRGSLRAGMAFFAVDAVNDNAPIRNGDSAHAEARYAAVIECADELIVRWTAYIDVNEARPAAERLAVGRG
jgi:hypothetical protein